MTYKLTKIKTIASLSVIALSLFAAQQISFAQGDASNMPADGQKIEGQSEAQKGPVTLYGQTLNPYLDYYEKPGERGYEFIHKYNAYRWDDMKHLVPQLFPDANEKKMTADQLCDYLVAEDRKYLDQMEQVSYQLADAIIPHFPNLTEDLEFLDEVDHRLRSRDPKALEELIGFMPNESDAAYVKMARDLQLKSWVFSILRDAALYQCPERAREKKYYIYTKVYTEPYK